MQSSNESVLLALDAIGRGFVGSVMAVLPRVAGAIALLLLGWIVGRLARRLTLRLFRWTRISDLADSTGLSESLQKAGLERRVGELVGGLAYFVVFVLFLTAASDVMGWSVVSETLAMLTAYVPNLLAAALLMGLAIVVSRPARSVAASLLSELEVPFHRAVAGLVRWAILIAGGFVALRQLGIDTRFLDGNVYMVVGGAVLVVAVPLALGARLVVGNLMSGLYVRRLYSTGQEVCLGQRKAVVKSVNEVSVVFESEDGDIYVPHSQLISRGYQA